MENSRLLKYALYLALFTIVYNILEGLVSVFFGYSDESLTLLGFGFDSFIEVLSGVGIAHMILRTQNSQPGGRDEFESTALKITGTSFYLLTLGLVVTSIYNIFTGHNPVTTLWGIFISVISIIIMLFLVYGKRIVGNRLNSEAILADAECTMVCVYMSVILLLASVVYALFRIPYIDSAGTLGLAYFSFREGRESFEKAAKQV